MNWGYCSLIVSFVIFSAASSNPLVNTTNGLIEGTYFTTWSGRVICAFLGIPYADPLKPHGRLQNAKMSMGWAGIYPAKRFSQKCIQIVDDSFDDPVVGGGDDCLFLNIFTPSVTNTTKLEVVFFIHGGSFMHGSGDLYTPDFLMDRHNIVFVTVNYRLGPLGFLSTEDEVIPGNLGLKDQALALKWVRDNIEYFGGNKKKITLLGEDAGAASVHMHYMSPTTKHLFKQGISLGGSAFCPWALSEKPRLKAELLARSMHCRNTTSQTILNCFQNYPHNIMMEKVKRLFMPWNSLPFAPFGPVIEKTRDNFLNDHPHKIIQENKFKDAPWLVGLTTHEGLYPGAKFAKNHEILEELDENWHKIAPFLLDYNHTVPRQMMASVSEKIRQFYFGNGEISAKLRREFIEMLGDRFFVADTEKAVRLQASASKSYVFLYKFGYRGRHSKAFSLCGCSDNMGASHGDDLLYLFKTPGYNVTDTKYGEALMRQMVDIIISFVVNGFPKVDDNTIWKPVQREAVKGHNIHYMEILTSKHLTLKNSPDLGNRRFWSSLHLAELHNILGEHKKLFDEL